MKSFKIALSLLAVSSLAFAESTEGGAGLSAQAAKYLAYFFGVAIASFGGTRAQSAAAAVALEGIARNPNAADKIQTPMILGLALMESLVIFMLITVFLV